MPDSLGNGSLAGRRIHHRDADGQGRKLVRRDQGTYDLRACWQIRDDFALTASDLNRIPIHNNATALCADHPAKFDHIALVYGHSDRVDQVGIAYRAAPVVVVARHVRPPTVVRRNGVLDDPIVRLAGVSVTGLVVSRTTARIPSILAYRRALDAAFWRILFVLCNELRLSTDRNGRNRDNQAGYS